MAECLRGYGVRTVNISLDTLDRADYARTTGRDFLPQTLAGIQAARDAGFGAERDQAQLRAHARPQRGATRAAGRFAGESGLLLRFIELMPVSTTDVLTRGEFPSHRRRAPPDLKRTSAR